MTLVEMLLAVTLFSTLMGSMSGLLNSGMRSQLEWGRTLTPYQQMERAFQRLEQDLGSAQPFFGVPVVGEEGVLEFARVDSSEWIRVSYRLKNAVDGLWLVREEWVWRSQAEGTAPLRREPLVRLTGGQFAFGMLDAQGQLTWVSSWDGKQHGIPRLVKLDCAWPAVNNQPPVELSRVIRHPAGSLPKVEETHE